MLDVSLKFFEKVTSTIKLSYLVFLLFFSNSLQCNSDKTKVLLEQC